MKKGSIFKKDDKLYLLIESSGTGKEKIFKSILYTENEKRFLAKILPEIIFDKKQMKDAEVVEHYSPKEKKSGKVVSAKNEPLSWWEEFKLTEPTLKDFVCRLVEKYGHPYKTDNSYVKSISKLYRGLTKDERTQEEIDAYPYYKYKDLSPKESIEFIINEIKKYVKPCVDLYGHKTLDYDYEQFAYAWVVEKYYGDVYGEPIKDYRYYHERFPEDERFAKTKLIKEAKT